MSDNPVRAATWMTNLALAQACPRCGARTRSGGQCLGMRMANGKCRMHGGASPGAPRGAGNGMWRHGLRSIEAIERRREMTAEMRRIRREISAGLR
jgi:glucans biosynthesis protein